MNDFDAALYKTIESNDWFIGDQVRALLPGTSAAGRGQCMRLAAATKGRASVAILIAEWKDAA